MKDADCRKSKEKGNKNKDPVEVNRNRSSNGFTSGDNTSTLKKPLHKQLPMEGGSARTPSSSSLTRMVGSWVFILEKDRSPDNAFNKKMTRKTPLLGITTEGQT
jgi:hypothetical protein